jgi:nitroimidazol reductase NimA-like FMN-containing flavoprotein (pyridoxamine 5'-phosphate oxidase superfamily)
VIPIQYIYDPKTDEIYIHGAKKGRKIDAIKDNPRVCFEIDEMTRLVVADIPCEYDQVFRSVIAFGRASFVDTPSKKVEAMRKIFEKYAKEALSKVPITEKTVEGTQVIRIKIESKTGKENKGGIVPYPQP